MANAETEEIKEKWRKEYVVFHKSHAKAQYKIITLLAVIISTGFTLYFYMVVKRFAYLAKEAEK